MNRTITLQAPAALTERAAILAPYLGVSVAPGGVAVAAAQGGVGIALSRGERGWRMTLEKPGLFARALGLLVENWDRPAGWSLTERPRYESLGAMLDCSRNAVPSYEGFARLAARLALMGYDTIQLYMEDVYEIPEYSYFGYMRGRYSRGELQRMDAFAARVGIELVPAVQTLAHLGQSLKWKAFERLVDVGDILLIGEEKTYDFLDAMFTELARCFSSRKINIGMDEAHLVGMGNYLKRNGYEDRLTVMLRHFQRVHALAQKHGLRPMLWSDMFFRLASGGDYYAPDCAIDPAIAEAIPEDTTLIYWDYYTERPETYDGMFEKHLQMTKNLLFAGGAWKWTGFSPNNRFSFHIGRMAHESCLRHGVRRVLVTAWGDDGAECPLTAVLPTFQFWAEQCFRGEARGDDLRDRFGVCCGAVWEDFLALDDPGLTPCNPAPGKCAVNPPKYLLYQDLLNGLFDRHIEKKSYSAHFSACAARFGKILERPSAWDYLFETQRALCEVLAVKCRLGIDLREAYRAGDRDTLRRCAGRDMEDLLGRIARFAACFRRQWERENKRAGLDVFDIRIGALTERIRQAGETVTRYLEGGLPRIEELENEPLFFDGMEHGAGELDIEGPFWNRIASPSGLAAL